MKTKYIFTSPYSLGLPIWIVQEKKGKIIASERKILSIKFDIERNLRIGVGKDWQEFSFTLDSEDNIIEADHTIFFSEKEALSAAEELNKMKEEYNKISKWIKEY